MKIIYLCPSLDRKTGWNRYSYDVITRTTKQAKVVVLCNEIDESIDASIPQNQSSRSVHGMPQKAVLRKPLDYLAHPFWVLRDARRIRKTIAAELSADEPNFIHCTVEGYAMFIPFLRKFPAKTLMTTHGTYSVLPLSSILTRWLYKRVYRYADRIVSVSGYTKRHMMKEAGNLVDEEKIYVVNNGVDFEQKPSVPKKDDGLFRIVTVGELKNRKGGHHLLAAAKILRDKYGLKPRVTFVGNVDKEHRYYKQLQSYIEEHNLQDVVHFAGMVPQEELDAYYSEADLFALLSVHEGSHYEGYPLVFHEAAMWGVPTVGTYDCGAEDAIKDGFSGVLVHPENHEEVAEKMSQIQSGEISISPENCKAWAEENDWGKKDLMGMYEGF
tara:strand:- start:468 stop:1619 length:1152 start_codon:yes stop_codon:yes gene_type:complete